MIALAPAGRRRAAAAWWFVPALARRRLLVPAQPDRRRQPDPPGRATSARSRCPTPSACRRAGPTSASLHYATDTGVWRDYFVPGLHHAFGVLWPLVARSGRWRGALSPCSGAATGSLRWIGGGGPVRDRSPTCSPRSAPPAPRAHPVAFAINIRYRRPGPARRRSPCCRCLASSTTAGASGRCSPRCSSLLVAHRPLRRRPPRSLAPLRRWPSRSLAGPGPGRRCLALRARAAPRAARCSPAFARAGAGVGRDRLPGPARLPRRPLRQRRAREERIPGMRPRLRLPLGPRRPATPGSAWPGPRPASSATASTAPTSPTASSTSARRGPHGAFNAIPTCAELPRRGQRRRPRLPGHRALPQLHRPRQPGPLTGGGLAARRRPRSTPVERQRRGDRLEGRRALDPTRCGPANAPLRRIPQRRLLTRRSAGYDLGR